MAHTRLRARPSEPQGAVIDSFDLKASDTNTAHHTERGCDGNMGKHASEVINNMLLLGVSHWLPVATRGHLWQVNNELMSLSPSVYAPEIL